MTATFVLDAGALVALERADDFMLELLRRVRAGRGRLILPDPVLAQAWRGGSGRQARISTLAALRPEFCERVPLDTDAAKQIGARIAECGHSDVIDVHVALLALQHSAVVITSDRSDIETVDAALHERIVDI